MNVRYCGPALDYSGYGEANRHDIAALCSADIGVTVELTKHCLEISEFGKLGELCRDLTNRQIDYQIKILHTTPNIYNQFIEPGKYHIGRVFWETDKLPPDFAAGCMMCDELWTGSDYNAQAIRNAGVDKPIYIIPEAIETDIHDIEPFVVPKNGEYRFYSIFEWTERKNPLALLEAYFREFYNTDGVALILKTYVDNFTPEKKQIIDSEIAQLKRRVPLEKYPPVYLYRKLMNRQSIYSFHKAFDCFVSAHRGEGWGIPQMEAMLLGKPMISTNCGGVHEYLKDKENAFLVPYTPIELPQMTRNSNWYRQDQHWADVDILQLRRAMRWVYENQDESKIVGENSQRLVKEKFGIKPVGIKMRDRLRQVQKHLDTKSAT